MESIQRTSGFGFYPSSLHSLWGGDGAWREGCTIFPTYTPKIILLAWVPHLHMTAACQGYMGSEGAWPRDNPDGVVRASAQHKPSLHQCALVMVLLPFLTPQCCQINYTLLVWRISTLPHPPPISIQGIIPQETPLRLIVLRDPHPNICSSITLKSLFINYFLQLKHPKCFC